MAIKCAEICLGETDTVDHFLNTLTDFVSEAGVDGRAMDVIERCRERYRLLELSEQTTEIRAIGARYYLIQSNLVRAITLISAVQADLISSLFGKEN